MCWANIFLHEQTCAVCEKEREEKKYICVVFCRWGYCITHTLLCSYLFWMHCQQSKRFSHLKKMHASYKTCQSLIHGICWYMGYKKVDQTGCRTSRVFSMATGLKMCFIFHFSYFAWLAAKQVVGKEWAKLCRLPIKSNFIKPYVWV